jgi:hypothetical protein
VNMARIQARNRSAAMFTDLAEQAGAPDPASLGRQLQLLYDGAGLAARMDHCDPGIEPSARDAAQALLDAALTRSHQAGSRVRADRSEVVALRPSGPARKEAIDA